MYLNFIHTKKRPGRLFFKIRGFLPVCAEVKLHCSDRLSCLTKGIYGHASSEMKFEHASIILKKNTLSFESGGKYSFSVGRVTFGLILYICCQKLFLEVTWTIICQSNLHYSGLFEIVHDFLSAFFSKKWLVVGYSVY